jgi:hypothetical protein
MARKKDTDAIRVGVTSDFTSGEFRTRFAAEAVGLAELFKLVIGSIPLSGPVRYHVELSAPDGPSTGGGVQAVQHVKLVPEDGGMTVVAGSANQNESTCELRTLDYLDGLHRQRFLRSSLEAPPLPSTRIDRKHYDQLLERLRVFFSEREIAVRILSMPELPEAAVTQPRPAVIAPERAGSTRGLALLLGALLGASVVVALYFFATR